MLSRARWTGRSIPTVVAALAVGAAFHVACSPAPPLAPSQVSSQPAAASVGAVRAQNAPPTVAWKTQPPADSSTTPPTVTGQAPFEVTFNLCNSDDPDMFLPDGSRDPNGDSLNWQFNFGDGAAALNPDGTFNPDYERFCRTKHTYGAGTYVATLSVTDKHLDSESQGVTAMARRSQLVKIVALSEGPVGPAPTPYCHALPQWCPSKQEFCEASPIQNTSSAHAKDACETCYGAPCVDGDHDGRAWVASGVTAFFYTNWVVGASYCNADTYKWEHKPGDIGDITPGDDCGAGSW